MKTYLRILAHASPYGKIIPLYVILTSFYILFSMINFSILIPLLEVLFDQVDIEETRKDFHTVQVKVQYNKPLQYGHEIEIGTKIKEIGNSSITWVMGMFLKDSDELVSSCEAVHVYTDQTTMKPTPITEDLKEKLQFN